MELGIILTKHIQKKSPHGKKVTFADRQDPKDHWWDFCLREVLNALGGKYRWFGHCNVLNVLETGEITNGLAPMAIGIIFR